MLIRRIHAFVSIHFRTRIDNIATLSSSNLEPRAISVTNGSIRAYISEIGREVGRQLKRVGNITFVYSQH